MQSLPLSNYQARKFGCRSAMPVFMALEKCPELLIVPTRFDVYTRDSQRIREIFARFTPLVEPLSLDEAFLDVSHHAEPATFVASLGVVTCGRMPMGWASTRVIGNQNPKATEVSRKKHFPKRVLHG